MIVLDTNVVSELMRSAPDPGVVAWVDGRLANELYLTSMTAAELLYGVALLPVGRRREQLAQKLAMLLDDLFEGRILPFDVAASVDYARIASGRTRAGTPIGAADAIIAATAAAVRADAIATRNELDFVGAGVAVINPWAN